jgi:hypothetical protein
LVVIVRQVQPLAGLDLAARAPRQVWPTRGIFTQAARAIGPGRPAAGTDPLGGLTPRLVIACGASQSAARLGAYLNMAATGGIRVPELEAPVAVHSGSRPGNPLAALIGQTVPYPPARLAARYPDAEAYLRAWDAAVDRAREQGLLLGTDLEELRQRGRKIAAGLW